MLVFTTGGLQCAVLGKYGCCPYNLHQVLKQPIDKLDAVLGGI